MERKKRSNCENGKQKNKENPTENKITKMDDNLQIQSTSKSPSVVVLNDDILLMIFSFLTMKDLITIERVSKKWRALSLMSWINIKKLNFPDDIIVSKDFRIEDLEKVLEKSGAYLKHLVLYGTYDYGDDYSPIRRIILDINKYCKNLTHLIINLGDYPDRKNLDEISTSVAENLKSLHITMYGNEGKCEETLENLLKKAINLEEFKFKISCSHGAPLRNLTERCKILSVSSCWELDNEIFKEVLEKLPHLEELDFSGCTVMAEVLSSVSNQLVSLDVSFGVGLFFLDDEIKKLSLENLRVLNMGLNPDVNNKVFLTLVKKCPLLEELNMSFCPRIISIRSFGQLRKLKNLTILNVDSTNITDNAIKYLGLTLKKLKEVSCRNVKHVTNSGFLKLIEVSTTLRKLIVAPSNRFARPFFESAKTCVQKRLDLLPLTISLDFGCDKLGIPSEVERLNFKKFSPDDDCFTIVNRWGRKKFNENPIIWCI